uniref:Uncharacterized protein n=1 Tax=Strombidium cf. sulcatum TaxID=2793073 RepID=A0A7T0M4P6_9SPIT|nr:hypothetical protein J6674_mgp43 [Strombidium cf. sulcatum]QPL15946.1 hypothetical protein [Strombidium cf. sulcatum]
MVIAQSFCTVNFKTGMKAYGLAFFSSITDYVYHAFKSLIYFVDFVVKYMPHAMDVLFVLVDTSEIFILLLLAVLLIIGDFLLISFVLNLNSSNDKTSGNKSNLNSSKNDDYFYNFFKYYSRRY